MINETLCYRTTQKERQKAMDALSGCASSRGLRALISDFGADYHLRINTDRRTEYFCRGVRLEFLDMCGARPSMRRQMSTKCRVGRFLPML